MKFVIVAAGCWLCALVVGSSASGSDYSDLVVADGPLAYWRLGDAPGSFTAADSVGVHDGIVFSGVTFGQPSAISGDSDTAAAFLGGLISVPHDDAFQFGEEGDFSLEGWFLLPEEGGSVGAMINKGDTNGSFWMLAWSEGFVGANMDYGSTGDIAKSTETFNDGQWHHIVAVADRDVSMSVYVDKILVAESETVSSGGDVSSDFDLSIGQLNENATFTGSMDELAIYDYALSKSQIDAHYDAAIPPSEGLPGDYNGDSIVDAVDYAFWRDNLDEDSAVLAPGSRDMTNTGNVNSQDYSYWRSNYGASSTNVASAFTVPEPASATLVFLCALGVYARRTVPRKVT